MQTAPNTTVARIRALNAEVADRALYISQADNGTWGVCDRSQRNSDGYVIPRRIRGASGYPTLREAGEAARTLYAARAPR